MFIIKRYQNRKYYNCTLKQYTNLKEMLLLLQAGKPIQVMDQQTGEDITAKTIAKVISTLPAQHLQGINHLLHPQSEENTDIVRKTPGKMQFQQGNNTQLLSIKNQYTFIESASILSLVTYLISYLNLPSKEQLDKLNAQIDELNKKVDTLF